MAIEIKSKRTETIEQIGNPYKIKKELNRRSRLEKKHAKKI